MAWIYYGYPMRFYLDLATEVEEGSYDLGGRLFTLGGCVVMDDAPGFRCLDCSADIGRYEPDDVTDDDERDEDEPRP